MIFELQGKLQIDSSKPCIAFYDKGDVNGYTHIYGAARVIKEELKKYYNIIEIGTSRKLNNNYYELKRNYTDLLIRKNQSPNDYLQKNSLLIDKWLDESFKDLPILDYIILGTDDFFRLPLSRYSYKDHSYRLYKMANEFFDYVGDDPNELEKIDIVNDRVVNEWDRLVSPFAFSTVDYSIFTRSINHIHKMGKLKNNVVGFSIDPAIYTPYFEKNNIPAKFYYFAEDKRGTRNFEQLDIAQLQHIIYDKKFNTKLDDWDDSPKQTRNMFFAGTVFQEKGSRSKLWNDFLKDVQSEDCAYFIPLRKNGINKSINGKSKRLEDILKEDKQFNELFESVTSHKNFKGSLLPHELNNVTSEFKYGMVFRCVSINDSLNFRPVLYSYMNIVPLLDYQYDPAFLQIPKHIQDKIVVHNSKEIDERIKFFNENDKERLIILQQLRDLFKIDNYINNTNDMIKIQIHKIIPDFKY